MSVVVITSIVVQNDKVSVDGTVDGAAATVILDLERLNQFDTALAQQTLIAQELRAVVQSARADLPLTGTITI